MNIGEASKASKVSAKMIRYYEQIGLIPPADRTDSGYRAYTRTTFTAAFHPAFARPRLLGGRDHGLLGLWNDKSPEC
jgi:MerR family gold-responsive transcriptional activator of gol and ges genes